VDPGNQPRLRLSELIASLALATDMAMGHPMEQGLGTALVSTRLGELAGLSTEDLSRTYYLALLRHIGCTTERDGLAGMVGDEIDLGAVLDPLSGAKSSEYMAAFLRFVTTGRGPVDKARAVGRLIGGMRQFTAANRAICEVAQMLASRLGFDVEFTGALGTVYERWDGKGFPNHVKGTDIHVAVRLTQVADLASALHDLGHDDVMEVVRSRSGSGFDPELVDLFVRNAPDMLAELEAPSRWDAVQRLEPGPRRELAEARLDEALGVAADFADLQSTFLVGHSSGVATLARRAAQHLPIPASDVDDLRRAALVHDLGRVGVSAGIWSKPGQLSAGEWEGVRLHPYHTDRVLQRAPFLARLAAIASMHHERLDGSGYFRGAVQLSPAARVLAAADVYHAMIEPRPHRAALGPERAAAEIQREVRSGRLDRESVDAVLVAAGHRVGRRKEHAAGLTAREVEVIRLLARGMSTKDIARTLVVSPKTAENHIHSIYAKAQVTTRAAATVFAMQHGLMDPLSV
jgi:HD-GYP domain-containing protein (c-di-GMP phosphodiesterase class II)